jgi:hypothetical protein
MIDRGVELVGDRLGAWLRGFGDPGAAAVDPTIGQKTGVPG